MNIEQLKALTNEQLIQEYKQAKENFRKSKIDTPEEIETSDILYMLSDEIENRKITMDEYLKINQELNKKEIDKTKSICKNCKKYDEKSSSIKGCGMCLKIKNTDFLVDENHTCNYFKDR
jgi:DNA repair ATPase RecN